MDINHLVNQIVKELKSYGLDSWDVKLYPQYLKNTSRLEVRAKHKNRFIWGDYCNLNVWANLDHTNPQTKKAFEISYNDLSWSSTGRSPAQAGEAIKNYQKMLNLSNLLTAMLESYSVEVDREQNMIKINSDDEILEEIVNGQY